MRSFFIALLLFFLFSCNSNGPKLGYVESDRLLSEFNETQDAAKKIEEETAEMRNRFDTLKMELDQLQKEFTKNIGSYSPTEREEKEAKMNQKGAEVNRYYNIMSEKIREEDEKVTQELLKKIDKVVKEYGEKHQYDIIFGATRNGNVVYAKETTDLTDEIILLLNR